MPTEKLTTPLNAEAEAAVAELPEEEQAMVAEIRALLEAENGA